MPQCIACNGWADAYFCVGCSLGSDYVSARVRYDHGRAPTGTSLGRAMRVRADRAAQAEQYQQLQTCNDSGVSTLAEPEETGRCNGIRRLRIDHNDPSLSVEESRSLRVNFPDRIDGVGDYWNVKLRRVRRIERRRMEDRECIARLRAERRDARQWWIYFCGEWGAIGYVHVDLLTRPGVTCAA